MKKTDDGYILEMDEYEKFQKDNILPIPQDENAPPKPITETSLYDVNIGIVSQMPTLDVDKLPKHNWKQWVNEHEAKYYMFLCNELKYYTVFHNTSDVKLGLRKGFIDFLKEENLGEIKVFEPDTNGAFSVWLIWPADNQPHCFYLFPYDRGVVEV